MEQGSACRARTGDVQGSYKPVDPFLRVFLLWKSWHRRHGAYARVLGIQHRGFAWEHVRSIDAIPPRAQRAVTPRPSCVLIAHPLKPALLTAGLGGLFFPIGQHLCLPLIRRILRHGTTQINLALWMVDGIPESAQNVTIACFVREGESEVRECGNFVQTHLMSGRSREPEVATFKGWPAASRPSCFSYCARVVALPMSTVWPKAKEGYFLALNCL